MKNWDRATVLAILSGGILIGFASAMGVVAITNVSSYQEPLSQSASNINTVLSANDLVKESEAPEKQLPEVEQSKAEPPPPSDQPTEKEKEFVRKQVRNLGATGRFEEIYWESTEVDAANDNNEMLGNTQLQLRPGDRGAILHLRSTDGAKWRVGYMAVAFYAGTDRTDTEGDIDGRMIRPMKDRPQSKKEIRQAAIMREWSKLSIEDANRSPRDRVGIPSLADYMRAKEAEMGIGN